jgi:hypothetical protein
MEGRQKRFKISSLGKPGVLGLTKGNQWSVGYSSVQPNIISGNDFHRRVHP